MATSLAAQLKAIASIDADRLTSHHGAPVGKSYLFTPAVAASHDTSAIYNIAATGFEELLQVDPELEMYEEELFSPASKTTDRMLLTQKENKRVNKALDACIRKLGKWITLKATSKCLEWLIRRFRVNELNVSALLAAFLPYHDSPYFPRILAIVTLDKSLPLHNVLHPLQAQPVALDRTLLVRGMLPAKDPSLALLREVLQLLPIAVKEGNVHQTLLTFWTATMVEFLERIRHDQAGRSEDLARVLTDGLLMGLGCAAGDERVLSAILPSLLVFLRAFNHSDAPYATLLAATTLPTGPQRAASVALAVLAAAPEASQIALPSAWAETIRDSAFLDALVEASGKTSVREGLQRLLSCMLKHPSNHQSSLLHLLNAEKAQTEVVQLAADILTATVSENERSAEDRQSAREVLQALSQRHRVQAKPDSVVAPTKPSAKRGKGQDYALADLYAADPSQRIAAIKQILTTAEGVTNMSPEDIASAKEGILARLGDNEEGVIDAIYSNTAALFQLIAPIDLLRALWPIMSDSDAGLQQTQDLHSKRLRALRKDGLFASPELQFHLFSNGSFPRLLRTHETRKIAEKVLDPIAAAKLSEHDVLRGVRAVRDAHNAGLDDHWAVIAGNIMRVVNQQSYITFLVAQSDAGNPYLALAAHRLLTEIMLQATADVRLGLSQAILQTASTNIAQSLAALSEQDMARLDKARSQVSSEQTFAEPQHAISRLLTSEALLMTLSQVNAPERVAWLGRAQSPVQDNYRAFAINLYAAVNSLRLGSDTATSLLRSLLWRVGEAALSFFAAVWTSSEVAVGAQHAALQHSVAFVRAFDQAAGVDFQCIVPSILVSLQSANKQIRLAGVTLLQTLLDSWVANPSDVYGAKDIYGNTSDSIRLLRASDFKTYLQQLLAREQDIIVSSGAIVEAHRQLLEPGAALTEEHNGGKWRKHLLTYLASHVVAWRDDLARSALIGLMGGGKMDKAKLQALQPYLIKLTSHSKRDRLTDERKWLSALAREELSAVLTALFAPMDKPAARHFVRDDPELLANYERLIRGRASSVAERALRLAIIGQLSKAPFGQMTIVQQADLVEAILAENDESKDGSNERRLALQNLPFTSILTVEILHRLQTRSGVSDNGAVSKRSRTEDANSADPWISLITFVESRAAANAPGDESVLIACTDLLSSILAAGPSLDAAVANHLQQVLLRWMTRSAESIKASGRPVAQTIGVEVIVKLIRGSPNPRTAQDALLLLGSLASFSPDAVLHNIMPVFTYMGSDEMQRDDAHSIAVVEKTIESIVPVLLNTHRRQGAEGVELAIRSNDLLQIFTDMAQRLPKHRAVPFFVHLVRVLGADVFLGPIEMLLVERYVRQTRQTANKSAAGYASSLPFLLENQFSTSERLLAVASIVQEIVQLRRDPGASDGLLSFFVSGKGRPGLETNEARLALTKQLASFVSKVLQSVTPTTEHRVVLKALAENLVAEAAQHPNEAPSKPQHALEQQLGQAAQSALNLLPAFEMVDVCVVMSLRDEDTRSLARRVLIERLPTIRRDVRESVSPRIVDLLDQYVVLTSTADAPQLSATLPLLLAISKAVIPGEDALLSRFVPLLLAKFEETKGDSPMRSDILAYMAEMPKRLGPRLIPHLRQLFAICLAAANGTANGDTASTVSDAFRVAAAAIANLPGFLPQADLSALVLACIQPSSADVLACDSVLSAIAKHVKGGPSFNMLFEVWAKLRERRVLNLQRYFKLLQKVVRGADRAVLPTVIKPLFNLYLEAFDVTATAAAEDASSTSAQDNAIDSFVDLVVKLNEATFKPLLGRLHDWAVVDEAQNVPQLARHATLYRVLERLLHKFQAIMLPYLSLVEEDIFTLLKGYQRGGQSDGNLWLATMSLLGRSFAVRSGSFWTTEKLTAMIPTLASQSQAVSRLSVTREAATDSLAAMFVALAQLASSSEVLLKSLNTAILLETRADDTATRLAALECLKAIWKKNGEDMISLVPETVAQFLSELMEDEHSDVEKVAREVLTVIEGFVGDLQSYLT